MDFIRSILRSPRTLRRMAVMLGWNCFIYYGGRILTRNFPHADITTALDASVPFLPWTVSVYFLAFVFWAVNYVLALTREEAEARHFYRADVLSRSITFAIFLLFPTTMYRVPVEEGGFWNGIMRLLYRLDEPNMLFPSVHCLNSVLAFLGIRGDKRLPRAYEVFSFLAALAICISTLTTRQHVLWDVVAGVSLGAVCYGLCGLRRKSEIISGR